ncbi:MurR/RpiR family transcriptional regulator, partial [bacterium]|nr:MurR/RpiR family transcriptional regulator [bacterium]
MGKKVANFTTLIAEAGSELTPTERRIAEVILAEPTLLAFGTVSDLASRVGTSRPSIVRFAQKLGFEGYPQLQQMVRSDVSRQLTRPSERIRQGDSPSLSERKTLDGAIDSVFEATAGNRLSRLIKPIAKARKVWILSGETSLAGAYAFRSGLSMIRPDVQLLDDRTIGRELSNTDRKDVAVVFDFFRYRRVVVNAARIL